MPTAIVTGATQGIGKAIANRLLSEGFDIAICARTVKDLEQVKQGWQTSYPERNVFIHLVDLSLKDDVKAFGNAAIKELGNIDLLVNNVGVYQPGNLADEEEGLLEKMMEINVYSAYHLTRAILPNMKAVGSGQIFNICSVASLKAYPNGGSYSITKYALLGFSENLREELKTENIKVTAICPGATYSRSWDGVDVEEERIMQASDVAEVLWSAYTLSKSATVETIVMRPTEGDL